MPVLEPEFPGDGSPFSRQGEREQKVAAIISAAAAQFNRYGVRGSRQAEIASELGLTKTSISYYFHSKEELAEAVFARSVADLEAITGQAEAASGDAASKLFELFKACVDQLSETVSGRRAHIARLQELDFLSEASRTPLLRRTSDVILRVDHLVSEWIRQSAAPLRRSEPATFFIFAVLDWLNQQSGQLELDAFNKTADAVLSVVRTGLWIQPGAAQVVTTPDYATPGELPQIFDRETRNRMKREAFLKVGIRYFNTYGYEGVSLADVAATLGVTRGAFYYHIPDKLDFLDQCLDRSFSIVESALDEVEDRGGLAAIRMVLLNLIYRQAGGLAPLIRPALMSALPAARRKRYEARLRNISRRLGDWLANGVEAGEAADLEVDLIEPLLAQLLFLNGGFTVAAARDVTGFRLSEDPLNAAADYSFILQYGLKA